MKLYQMEMKTIRLLIPSFRHKHLYRIPIVVVIIKLMSKGSPFRMLHVRLLIHAKHTDEQHTPIFSTQLSGIINQQCIENSQ